MAKKIGIIVGIIVLVLIIALIVVTTFLGSIIKTAVNKVGPAALGVDVSLEDADFSLFKGRVKFKKLIIGNPEGFDTPSLCELSQFEVIMKPGSVMSDTIIIEKIHIDGPQFTYQRGLKDSNLSKLVDQLKGDKKLEEKERGEEKKEESKKPEKKGKGPSPKVIINDLIIENAKVNVSITALGDKQTIIHLPTIHLKDIGKKGNGATIIDVLGLVFDAIMQAILQAPALTANLLSVGAGLLEKGVLTGADTALDLGGKTVGEAMDGAEKTIEEAGKILDGAGKSIGKRFGALKGFIKKDAAKK